MTNGTNSTEQGLSAPDTATNDSHDAFEGALVKAMFDGNTAEVDRLMASKGGIPYQIRFSCHGEASVASNRYLGTLKKGRAYRAF